MKKIAVAAANKLRLIEIFLAQCHVRLAQDYTTKRRGRKK